MDYKSNTYCRVCLKKLLKDKQISLHDKLGDVELYAALQELTGLINLQNDGFTKKVCIKCAEQVRMAVCIRQNAIDSDAKMKGFVEEPYEKAMIEPCQQQDQIVIMETVPTDEFLSENIIYEEQEDENISFEQEPFECVDEEHGAQEDNALGDEYESEEELLSHETVTAENLHYCCKCVKVFAEEDDLFAHFSEAHKDHQQVAKKKMYDPASKTECLLCGSITTNMKKHRTHWHLSKPIRYICKDCGKGFREIRSRQRCESKHAGTEVRLQCSQCPRQFATARKLYEHVKKCTKKQKASKKKTCNICGILVNASYLGIHKRIHTGERPLKCSFCEKTFIQYTDHKRHEMMHTGERPYKCLVPSCGIGFVKKSYLTHHVERHHPETIEYN